jgi:hypothetical protein
MIARYTAIAARALRNASELLRLAFAIAVVWFIFLRARQNIGARQPAV